MVVANGVSGDQSHLPGGNGALAFDMEYARWLYDHQRLINDVRSAVNTHVLDNELRLLVVLDNDHQRRRDIVRAADLKYGAFQEVETAIAKIEGTADENVMLTETVGPEQIAEVVTRWTGIPVTRLGTNEKERLIGLAERLH